MQGTRRLQCSVQYNAAVTKFKVNIEVEKHQQLEPIGFQFRANVSLNRSCKNEVEFQVEQPASSVNECNPKTRRAPGRVSNTS